MKKLHEYETPLTDGAERECVLDSQLLDFARDLERKLALCRDALREAISERNDSAMVEFICKEALSETEPKQ
jgi:hypothetical protein